MADPENDTGSPAVKLETASSSMNHTQSAAGPAGVTEHAQATTGPTEASQPLARLQLSTPTNINNPRSVKRKARLFSSMGRGWCVVACLIFTTLGLLNIWCGNPSLGKQSYFL